MEIENTTKIIKVYCQAIRQNFSKIGKMLKQIRDNREYAGKYDSFQDYLDKEGFEFHRTTADKMIRIVEDPKLEAMSLQIGLSKTIELLYAPDKQIRDEIIEKVESGQLETTKDIREAVKESKRESNIIDREPIINTESERREKILNDFRRLSQEIIDLTGLIDSALLNTNKWESKAKTNFEDQKTVLTGLWNAFKLKVSKI